MANRKKYHLQYGNPSILCVAFTILDLGRDTAKHTNPVEGHMIEKQGVEEVTIMGNGSHLSGISHGKVIRLNIVTGKEYLVTFQPKSICPETQIKG